MHMDISMNIHGKSVDLDVKFHIYTATLVFSRLSSMDMYIHGK